MTCEERPQTSDDAKKLSELAYLCSSVSHHVINAFSSIVSNAEIIRAQAEGVPEPSELEQSGRAIVETALDASKVARKLIDWARARAAVDGRPDGSDSPTIDLNQLIRERHEAGTDAWRLGRVDWVLNLGSVPPIPGDAAGSGGDARVICCRTLARPCPTARERSRSRLTIDPRNLAGRRNPRHGMRHESGSTEAGDASLSSVPSPTAPASA